MEGCSTRTYRCVWGVSGRELEEVQYADQQVGEGGGGAGGGAVRGPRRTALRGGRFGAKHCGCGWAIVLECPLKGLPCPSSRILPSPPGM